MAVRIEPGITGLPTHRPRVLHPRLRRPRAGAIGTLAGRGRGRYAVSFPRWLYNGYRMANAGDLAAAIAFNSLVALVPIVLLLVSVAGLFLRDSALLIEAVHASVWAFTPRQAHEAIETILAARRNTGWYGAISLIGFAWIGTNLVSCLARSMNRVYGVSNRRFVHQRFRDFFVILVFAIFFVLAAVAAMVPTLFVSREVDSFFARWKLATAQYQIISYMVSLLAAICLFLVLYRIIPNAHQRLRDVWPGTLTAAILFVIMAQVFPIYLREFGTIGKYSTAFGFVSLLVAWFYLLAHVVLFGTYVNATYQRQCRTVGKVAGRDLPGCERDGHDVLAEQT